MVGGGGLRHALALLVYGPPDWLVTKFDTRDRRAFGFWSLLAAATGAVFWGSEVLYVTILSVLALVPNYSSETPVEIEGDDGTMCHPHE